MNILYFIFALISTGNAALKVADCRYSRLITPLNTVIKQFFHQCYHATQAATILGLFIFSHRNATDFHHRPSKEFNTMKSNPTLPIFRHSIYQIRLLSLHAGKKINKNKKKLWVFRTHNHKSIFFECMRKNESQCASFHKRK